MKLIFYHFVHVFGNSPHPVFIKLYSLLTFFNPACTLFTDPKSCTYIYPHIISIVILDPALFELASGMPDDSDKLIYFSLPPRCHNSNPNYSQKVPPKLHPPAPLWHLIFEIDFFRRTNWVKNQEVCSEILLTIKTHQSTKSVFFFFSYLGSMSYSLNLFSFYHSLRVSHFFS
jgi:hypothetical protein